VFKLVCNIQSEVSANSGASTNVNTMMDGLQLNMQGTLEKHSDLLNRNALWKSHKRITKLPKYICVQFMRFFWKATPDNRDHAGLKCKIVRSVIFPEKFDVFPLCSEKLQAVLKSNRDVVQKQLNDQFKKSQEDNGANPADVTVTVAPTAPTTVFNATTTSSSSNSNSNAMDTSSDNNNNEEMDEEMKAALALSMQMDDGSNNASSSSSSTSSSTTSATTATSGGVAKESVLGGGLPSNFCGQYELMGIVTHKGRSADSGHYIGWVRKGPESDKWWKFDDDVVTEIPNSEVMQLHGGADSHIAYLNFYRYVGNK